LGLSRLNAYAVWAYAVWRSLFIWRACITRPDMVQTSTGYAHFH